MTLYNNTALTTETNANTDLQNGPPLNHTPSPVRAKVRLSESQTPGYKPVNDREGMSNGNTSGSKIQNSGHPASQTTKTVVTDLDFHCENCNKTYKLKSSLTRHLKACKKAPQDQVAPLIKANEHIANIDRPKCQKCMQTFASALGLSRHTKRKTCGTRTQCQFCDASFPTFPGVRQHERRAHPVEYNRELELMADKGSDEEMLRRIAVLEAARTSNAFLRNISEQTGLTVDQIRGRRKSKLYQDMLESERTKLQGKKSQRPHRDTGNQGEGPVAQAVPTRIEPLNSPESLDSPMISVKKVIGKSSVRTISSSPGFHDSQVAGPSHQRSFDASMTTTIALNPPRDNKGEGPVSQAVPKQIEAQNPPYSLDAPLTPVQKVIGKRSVLTISSSPGFHDSQVAGPSHQRSFDASMTTTIALNPLAAPFDVTTQSQPESDVFIDYITNNLERAAIECPTVLPLLHAALNNDKIALLSQLEIWFDKIPSSKSAKKAKSHRPPKHYGQVNTGSSQRSAAFKKAQDLYNKNRATLADFIIEGKSLTDQQGTELPSANDFEGLYANIWERQSPADNEPIRDYKQSLECFLPITEEDITSAKQGMKLNAPGPDRVGARTVKAIPDFQLSLVYTAILWRNVHPSRWAEQRSIMIYKDGDRKDPSNYRPITISSHFQRLLHKILAHRLVGATSLNRNQKGFLPTDGTLANMLIVDHFIKTRRAGVKEHHIVSLDIRKAFDTVSHVSIARALKRFGISEGLSEYIAETLREASTTICTGSNINTRKIQLNSGVKQGDPLSPILFNLVLDELLDQLQQASSEIDVPDHVPAVAYADDLVLLGKRHQHIASHIKLVGSFLKSRGMILNVKKCRSLSTTVHRKRPVVCTKPNFKIDESPVPAINDGSFLTYLGHSISTTGVTKPSINNLAVWLERVSRAPLKPDQKLVMVRDYLIPKMLYGLQGPRTTGAILRDADRLIRMNVRRMLHLNAHTADCFIHASIKDGGLGITRLRLHIPSIMLRRIQNLLESAYVDDPVVSVLASNYGQSLKIRLKSMAGLIPPTEAAKQEICSHTTTMGLEACSEDSSSRHWIQHKPSGWSGRDFVQAVQLRSNNLPTAAIPSNPEHLRQCRGRCGVPETLQHVIQKCPVVHYERIARHNEIARKIATHCRVKLRRSVEEEPHVRHSDGQLFKPDLAIHIDNETTVIADVQVSWEQPGSLAITHQRKKLVYDNDKFRNAAEKRWPGRKLHFTPVIIGARGIWPRCNSSAVEHLMLDVGIKRSCVHSALKWGPSIHGSFMRAVWRRSFI